MSKKPPIVKIGRIVIRTPEEVFAEAARAIKADWARTRTLNKKLLGGKVRTYNAARDMLQEPARRGATQHEAIPSRMGDTLIYRDGHTAAITPLESQS